MNKTYTGQVWEDYPSTNTKINATRLNAISSSLNEVDTRVVLNTARDLKDRNFILIGDSYGAGHGLGGNGWCKRFAEIYGWEISKLYYNPQGGAGFYATAPEEQKVNFEGCLRNLVTQGACDQFIPESDRPWITDIVVLGGYNDGGTVGGEPALEQKINEFIQYAISVFPNAMVRIGMIGWDAHNDTFNTLFNDVPLRAYSQHYDRATYLHGMEYICHDISQFQSDDIHPTADAVNRIVRALAQALNSGAVTENRYANVSYTSDVREYNGTSWGNVCGTFGGVMSSYISNGNTIVRATELVVQFDAEHSRYFENNKPIKLADLTGGYIVGDPYCYQVVQALIQYTENGSYKYREVPASVLFNGGRLYLYIEALNDANTGFLQAIVNNIYIRPFSFNIDSMRQV